MHITDENLCREHEYTFIHADHWQKIILRGSRGHTDRPEGEQSHIVPGTTDAPSELR